MRFDLNGLVQLEQRFTDLEQALVAAADGERLEMIISAFTRYEPEPPTEAVIVEHIQGEHFSRYWLQIVEGFGLSLCRGRNAGPDVLPLPYRKLTISAADHEALNRDPGTAGEPVKLAHRLRRLAWHCLGGRFTEEEIGAKIRVDQIHALKRVVQQALRRTAGG